ncbi:MAG: DUF4007 family protein [Bdellovibrionaceae bacterium]|nr:DUF4007 family protein [Pseudobdellovibrionaceae bacterium]
MLFAGHDTFHIREGWIHKGLRLVREKADIFAEENATDYFGIGKNMVTALRYWLGAANLIDPQKGRSTSSRKGCSSNRFTLSPLGELIYGYDPYIEEDSTLWILHYNLAINKERATTWYWFFNKFPLSRFESVTALNYLARWVESSSRGKTVKITSLQKDISCLARTYTKNPQRNRDDNPEDTFECPLSSLRLLDYLPNSDSFKINLGAREIPPAVMAYATTKFIKTTNEKSTETSLKELSSGDSSPGRVFVLSQESLLENVEKMLAAFPKDFHFTRTAGLNTVRIVSTDKDPLSFLKVSYKRL